MPVNYTQSESDPLLQSSSATSDYSPYIQAAQQASGILSNAAIGAGNTSANNYGLAQAQIQQGNQSSTNYSNPYTTLGLSATQRLQNLMTNPSSITTDPAYQFNLDQQMQQLQNKNVAGGKLLSGQNIDDVAKLTSGYASSAYQQQVQNNLAEAGLGQTSAINQGNQDFSAGQAVGAYQGQIGDTLGNAQVAAANAQARGLYDASRGMVAQSTSRSTPYNYGGTARGGVNNLGTQDSSIPMGDDSQYQNQVDAMQGQGNAAANATPNQNAASDTSGSGMGSLSSSTGAAGAAGSSQLGGASRGLSSGLSSAISGAANTAGGSMSGGGSGSSATAGGSLTGLSSAGYGSLGSPYSENGLSGSMPGVISGSTQSAIGDAAASAINMSKGFLPGESKAQYDVRQQRIWESQHPDVVASAVARGNRTAGSVFGG